MGQIRTEIALSRFDANHQLLEKRVQPSRSWTQHFFDLFYIILYAKGNQLAAVADITGVNRPLIKMDYNSSPNLSVNSPGGGLGMLIGGTSGTNYGSTAYTNPLTGEYVGIVVGSNAAAVTPADNALGVRIAHGEAATQLLYGGTEIYGQLFADPNGEMRIRRYFTNKSGGNVTVEEVGIYSPGLSAALIVYPFCIARDLTGGVVVADTEILEAEYTVQITV